MISNQRLDELLADAEPPDCSAAGAIFTGSIFAPPSRVDVAATAAAVVDSGVAVSVVSTGVVAVAVA